MKSLIFFILPILSTVVVHAIVDSASRFASSFSFTGPSSNHLARNTGSRSRSKILTNATNNDHGFFSVKQHSPQDIYIAGFFALSDHDIEAVVGQGVMPAIKLALRHVDHTNFLHDYRLHLLHNDTKCSASVGMKAFFDMMAKEPHKVMILGGSCTSVTDPIAKTSKHWRIPVLSYADTHPMFTKKNFPNFFRVVPSENAVNAARLKLLKTFGWEKVGTLYQNEPRFALAHNGLAALLSKPPFEILESQGLEDNITQALSKLREKDVRVILASFNSTWARRVFCEVYRIELYGPRYQWIIAGPRQEFWWREEDPAVNCSAYDILSALGGAFVVDVLPLTSSKEKTISGLTAQEYEKHYNQERGHQYSQFHGYAYDAIWTVALTVKNVIHKLHERNKNSGHTHNGKNHWSLRNFVYRDPGWEKLFLDALLHVNFSGVTGQVHFIDNERMGWITVKQIIGAHEIQVAEYDDSTDTLFLNEKAISWANKQPPKDRTIQITEPSRISFSVFAILATAAGLGIILASTFLAINIRFRNQRYIKMSSPYLNNMIIIGCLLTYTSVILFGLDSRLTSETALPAICTARIWTLMTGFTLAFGSMFSKTWRVHSIFTDVKLNKKAIKDYQLFMVVGVLLTIDIAILSTWHHIDPFYRETKKLAPYMDPSKDNVEIRPEIEYCKSEHMTSFVVSIYAYKCLLMVFGCFLAWETRNVNIPALNDSKYIGMSVYNVVIMCVIGAAISYVLSDQQDVSFIIISIFIIFCTTGTLCLVFVPKLIELKRNPQGTIEKRARATIKPTLPKYKNNNRSENSMYHKSKVRNAKLRKELRQLDDQIQKLLQQLGDDSDSLAKDGPSFSYKGDSDGRVPSVSGADTMSLSSLISSPEPTFSSPHHTKENGESGQGEEDNAESQPTDILAPASVAMWTAISNPLLLISHVLRKSMELQDSDLNSTNAVAPASQCEFVVERHVTPETELADDSLEERVSPVFTEVFESSQEDTEGNFISTDNGCDLVRCDGAMVSRCACHASIGRRLAESFSLNELPVTAGENFRGNLVKNRSISLHETLLTTDCYDPPSRSRSDSSFNYESNISEDKDVMMNYFEYQSLESVNSTNTECNSIRVTLEDFVTVVQCSPGEEEDEEEEEEGNSRRPQQEAEEEDEDDEEMPPSLENRPDSRLGENADNRCMDVYHRGRQMETELNHNVCSPSAETLNDNFMYRPESPVVALKADRCNERTRKSGKSRSAREKRTRSKKKRMTALETVECHGSSANQCSVSNPDIPQRKRSSMARTRSRDPSYDFSILPIFQQLIAQKHQETLHQQNQLSLCDTDHSDPHRMASCPNLSIKCDVVEYF